MSSNHFTLDRVVRLAVSFLIGVAVIWLIGYLSDVLIPFIVAFLFAYLLNPFVCLMQKKIPSRNLSIFIVLFLVVIGMTATAAILVPMVSREVSNMGHLLSKFADDTNMRQRASQLLPPPLVGKLKVMISKDKLFELMHEDKFWVIVQSAARKILPRAWDIFRSAANFLVGLLGLFVIGLYLVFLLVDYEKLKSEWESMLPPKLRGPIMAFIHDFDKSMHRYFRAQALVALCVGVLFAVGFSLIGLPMAVLLGLFLGLLNMVPYLQMAGIIPAVMMAIVKSLESGTSFGLLIGLVVLVFVVVQIIQDVVIVPRIMGKLTGLSPAMILLSISIWGKLLGFLGLVIAIPMTCLFLAYYHRFLDEAASSA